MKHFPAQSGVAAKLRELNLTNVHVINRLGGAMAINYGEKPKWDRAENAKGIRSLS